MIKKFILGSIIVLILSLAGSIPAAAANSTCSLSVTSVPSGGTVLIDGIESGLTPLADTGVSCEQHTVTVSHEGFDDYTIGIDLLTGMHRDIAADLVGTSNIGTVIIRSEPDAATLWVDDTYKGRTPLTLYAMQPGRHALLLRADGYEPYHDTVTATPGSTPEYMEYLIPLPDTGFLSIASSPDGASVRIDGNDAGTTPTPLKRMSAGNHTVTVYREGYWNFTRNVTLAGGKSLLAKADLTAIPVAGTLYLESAPAGMQVYLNGTYKGIAPVMLDGIGPGNYLLEFRQPAGASANRTVGIAAGGTYEIIATIGNDRQITIESREWQYQDDSSLLQQDGWVSVNTTPVIEKTYTWIAVGHKAKATLVIPQDLYEYYQGQSHQRNLTREDLSSYAISERDRQYLHALVVKLKDASNSQSYSARNDYRNVVSFVQSLQYQDDIDPITNQKTDYWKYPVETLADGGGDCEDSAILTAALLKEMGYDVAIVFYIDSDSGHAATAVACDNCNGYYYPLDGKRYYALETTGAGYSLGMLSEKYIDSAAVVIPL
jgi:predicted transglutaminase-like cysteine proteinase